MSSAIVADEVSSSHQLMRNAICLDNEQRDTPPLTSPTRSLVHRDLDDVEKECKALLELIRTLMNEAQKQQLTVQLADERVIQAKTSAAAALALAANTESARRGAQEELREAIRVKADVESQLKTAVSAAQAAALAQADSHCTALTKMKLQAEYDVERANAQRDDAHDKLRETLQLLHTEKTEAATAVASLRRQIASTSHSVPSTLESAESAVESAKQVDRIRQLKIRNGALEQEVAAVREDLKRAKSSSRTRIQLQEPAVSVSASASASASAKRKLRSSTVTARARPANVGGRLAVVSIRDTDSARSHRRTQSERTRRRITDADEDDDVETALPALIVAHRSESDGDDTSDDDGADSDYVQII